MNVILVWNNNLICFNFSEKHSLPCQFTGSVKLFGENGGIPPEKWSVTNTYFGSHINKEANAWQVNVMHIWQPHKIWY